MVAARNAGSSTDWAPKAHSLAQSLWTSQQQREIEVQKERTNANSDPLSLFLNVVCDISLQQQSNSDRRQQP